MGSHRGRFHGVTTASSTSRSRTGLTDFRNCSSVWAKAAPPNRCQPERVGHWRRKRSCLGASWCPKRKPSTPTVCDWSTSPRSSTSLNSPRHSQQPKRNRFLSRGGMLPRREQSRGRLRASSGDHSCDSVQSRRGCRALAEAGDGGRNPAAKHRFEPAMAIVPPNSCQAWTSIRSNDSHGLLPSESVAR